MTLSDTERRLEAKALFMEAKAEMWEELRDPVKADRCRLLAAAHRAEASLVAVTPDSAQLKPAKHGSCPHCGKPVAVGKMGIHRLEYHYDGNG